MKKFILILAVLLATSSCSSNNPKKVVSNYLNDSVKYSLGKLDQDIFCSRYFYDVNGCYSFFDEDSYDLLEIKILDASLIAESTLKTSYFYDFKIKITSLEKNTTVIFYLIYIVEFQVKLYENRYYIEGNYRIKT